MTAEVKVTHVFDFPGIDRFESALNTLAQKLENSIKSGGTNTTTNSGNNNQEPKGGKQDLTSNKATDTITKTTGKFDVLTTQIQNATTAINDFAKNLKNTSARATLAAMKPEDRNKFYRDELSHNADLKVQRQQFKEDDLVKKSQQRWKNIGAGVMTGSLLAAMYQSGNVGQVMGSESRAMNTGATDYNSFMRDYYNKRVGMEKSIGTTGIMGVAGAGIAYGASVGGLYGAAIGGVAGIAGGVGNYILGKSSEERQAMNEFAMSQDPLAYQLQARGISKIGSKSVKSTSGYLGENTYIPITQLQEQMMGSKRYAGYLPYATDVMTNSRPDIFKSTNQAELIRQTGRTSLLTGEKDVGSLAKAATNLAAMSGKDPVEVLKKQTENSLAFGGKVLSNMDKITNLMQHTGMGENKATELVNRYQFNDAALQTKVNMSMLTPQQGAQKTILGSMIKQMTGLDPDSDKNIQRYKDAAKSNNLNKNLDPVAMILGKYYEAERRDPYVSMGGAAQKTAIGSPKDSAVLNDFMEKAAKSIADIVVDTQYVSAGVVNLMGSMSTPYHAAMPSGVTGFSSGMSGYGTQSQLKKQIADAGKYDLLSESNPEYRDYLAKHPALAKQLKKQEEAFKQQANKSQVGRGGM